MNDDPVKVDIYLDDQPTPIGRYRPPASFELDTTKLPDGPHKLTVKAVDRRGIVGIREVSFIVRNGPGIAVVGLKGGDVVEGKIPVLVNAYGGTSEKEWEPKRAETPAPVPTWAWVLFLGVAAWSMFYWADNLRPGEDLANTPTFSSPARIAEAAGVGPAPTASRQGRDDRAAQAGFAWTNTGQRVYEQKCAVCHHAGGEGIPGFVQPLRANPRVNAPQADAALDVILSGAARGANPRSSMPGYAGTLSDAEIAAVTNWIRTSWGHNAPTITPADVAAARRRPRASP